MNKVEYEISPKDLIEFQIFTNKRVGAFSKAVRKIRISTGIYLAIDLVIYLAYTDRNLSPFPMFLLLIAAALVFSIFQAKRHYENSLPTAAHQMVGGENALSSLGRKTLTIEGDALEIVEPSESSRVLIAAIDEIDEDETNLYLYKDKINTIFIPKRFFSNEAEKETFIETLMA